MTVKKILAHQIGRLAMAVAGLALSLGLVFIGGTFENAIALAAGVLALAASVLLVSLDLALVLRSTNRIIEMAEPIYARQMLQLETRASSAKRLAGHPSLDAAFGSRGNARGGLFAGSHEGSSEDAHNAWVRDMAFIEGDNTQSAFAQNPFTQASMQDASAAQAAPLRNDFAQDAVAQAAAAHGEPTPLTPKTVRYGSVEFRTYEDDGSETELERLERISKESGPNGLRKKLLIAKVGTSLVDEASLGDYVEGHLSFKQLAFPEILPGFDLLASDDPNKFRRPSTWKEAIQRAAGEYDRTIVIVRADELRGYQDLMSRDSRVIDVRL